MSQAIDPAARVCGNCTGFEACQGVQLTDTPELLHCKEFSFKVAGAAPAGAIQTPQPASSPAAPMAPPVPEALAPAAPVAPQAPQAPAAPVAPPAPIAPPVAPQAPAAAPQAPAPATPPQAPTAPPAQASPPIAPPAPPAAAPVGGVTYPQTPPAAPSAPAAPVAPPAPQQAPAAPVAPQAPQAPAAPVAPPAPIAPAVPTAEVAQQMPATPPTAAPQAPGAAPVSVGVSVFDDVNQFLAMDPNATDAAGRKALVKMANNLIKNYKAAKKASNDAVSQANIGVALAYLEARKADVSNMDVAPEAPPAAPAAPVAPSAVAPQVPDAAPQAPEPEVAPTAEPAAPATECGSEPQAFEQYMLPAPRDVRETLDVTIALMCDKVITHLTSSSEPPCMMTVNSIKTLCEARRAYNGSVEPTLMSLLQKIVEDKSAMCDG